MNAPIVFATIFLSIALFITLHTPSTLSPQGSGFGYDSINLAQTKSDPTNTNPKPAPVKPERSFQEIFEKYLGINDIISQSILLLFPTSATPTQTKRSKTDMPPGPESTAEKVSPKKPEISSRSFQETLDKYHSITSILKDLKVLMEKVMPLSWEATLWAQLSIVASWGCIVGIIAYVMAKLLRSIWPQAAELADKINGFAIISGSAVAMIVNLVTHFSKHT